MDTHPFEDKSVPGNEKAFRKGRQVPDGGVNLAFFKSPGLSPENNVTFVDLSTIDQDNITPSETGTGTDSFVLPDGRLQKLYYANSLGVLEDISGNQLIADEYPVITDVPRVNHDWTASPTVDYVASDMLPFVHVSRHFHIDFSEQATSLGLYDYTEKTIKVIHNDGRDHVDANGLPLYRIRLAKAHLDPSLSLDQWIYRVYAYVDTDTSEDLYLIYNKMDQSVTGQLVDQEVGFRELLNPQPVLSYQPEETFVADPSNARKKWYSSVSASEKDKTLGLTKSSLNGYKVIVPRKAVPDPRLFQLFRWRVNCEFSNKVVVDDIRKPGLIRCGVVVTKSSPTSHTPYVFYNLGKSAYNTNGITFVNPLHENDNTSKDKAAYWYVNFDTVTNEQLAQFDILIWSPPASTFSFKGYSAKLAYFVAKGGTLFADFNSYTYPSGMYATTAAVVGNSGVARSPGPRIILKTSAGITTSASHELINGAEKLGGWKIQPGDKSSLSYLGNLYTPGPGYVQTFVWNPIKDGYTAVIAVGGSPVTVARVKGAGKVIISTFAHLTSCNDLFDFAKKRVVSENRGSTVFSSVHYADYINSAVNEGAMKFMYNIALWALKGKPLNTASTYAYSTNWTYSTPWKNSWVIDGSVLDDSEKQKYDFSVLPQDLATPNDVWQRKLSSQTVKQMIDDQIQSLLANDPSLLRSGMERTYSIEVTNPLVETPTVLGDNSFPYAWTTAYSPSFTVPMDIGPYSIREEEIKGKYEAGQYINRSYPAKPYGGRVLGNLNATKDGFTSNVVKWTAAGTATETLTITDIIPPSTTTINSQIQLSLQQSDGTLITGLVNPYSHVSIPNNTRIGQDYRYREYNSWPHYGIIGQFSLGSQSEVVAFIQSALNKFQYFGAFTMPGSNALNVNGYYDNKTEAAVLAFQKAMGAKYLDGTVDAETLALIGGQILRYGALVLNGTNAVDYSRFFGWANQRMPRWNFADGNASTSFMKRSWVQRGPSVISEDFFVHYDKDYKIYGISIIPQLEGAAKTINIWGADALHVNSVNDLANWNAKTAYYSDLPIRATSGQNYYLPFWAPRYANAIVVTLVQDQAGFGTSRIIGVQDILAHAEVETKVVVPAKTKIIHQTRTISISATGTEKFEKIGTVSIRVHPDYHGGGTLSNIHWDSVSTDNPFVSASISPAGVLELTPEILTVEQGSGSIHYTFGRPFPSTVDSYYHMTPGGVLSPSVAHGYVSKEDGIQLLANKDKTPYGFKTSTGETLFPTSVGTGNAENHFSKLTLRPSGVDPSVYMGFYDKKKGEYVQNADGVPEISFLEYLTRGPANIYIAVMSTYELDIQDPLPNSDGTLLPYRFAMPVYGVITNQTSRIKIDKLPATLGRDDYWPVPIRTGNFHFALDIPDVNQKVLGGWINAYQGSTIELFYSLPEAQNKGWSLQFGPPNIDVVDETPLILDDNTLQVRQPPIYMLQWPTGLDENLADPVRPIFKISQRPDIDSSWVDIPWEDVADFNATTGEIILRTTLTSTDENLWKISYTSSQGDYYFKGGASNVLDLNPFHGSSDQLIGKAIYIYISPAYARDAQGNTIAASIRTRCVQFTTDAGLFNPTNPLYDPTVIPLGIVYINTAFDINDLVLLDTRQRGGGAQENLSVQELLKLEEDAASYWDINYPSGSSYMKGGFVVIRLPAALKDVMTDQDIMNVIQRNITAGVSYKLEDLNGNSWDTIITTSIDSIYADTYTSTY